MHTGEIIRTLREKQGMSQETLASLLGYRDRSSIAKIEAGKVNLAQTKLKALCDIFNIEIHELLGLQPMPRFREIPIVGTIACGAPILAQEHIEGYTTIPQDIHADFALVCKGDSMVGARIFDGDMVYIRQQETVENGEIAAVIIDDHATLKRVYFYPEEQTLSLHAENPLYPPLIYKGDALREIRILGKAVSFHSKI